MTKAISPQEAKHEKQDVIPDEVLQVVNLLLKERYNGNRVRIEQREVLEEALALMCANGAHVTRDEFFKRHWLDFEQVYRNVGWAVTYDKPAYCESYSAHWVFENKEKLPF